MKNPNVVFILADDMGYGDFGIFSDGSAQTPNLDRLVKEGCALSHCYSASPVCAPARASLMTGRYPHRTGAVDTYEGIGGDRLSLRETTLAQVYQRHGYATGLIGKWHLGMIGDEYHPCNRGFDEFVGFRGGWSDYLRYRLECRGEIEPIPEVPGQYITHRLTEESTDFIRRHQSTPFFLHVAYNAPHFPFQCPEEYKAPFLGRFSDTLATLYGMIAAMDEGIGKILDTLLECGLDENTIVVFSSDNGPQLEGELNRYNYHLSGEKGTAFEGGIRVPAVVRWPGQIAADTRCHSFFHGCDWFPTLLEACGISGAETLPLDGVRRLASLTENRAANGFTYCWQWNRFTPVSKCNAAIREGKWKLLWPPISQAMAVPPEIVSLDERIKAMPKAPEQIVTYDDSGRRLPPPFPPQLYNLEDDPFEENNLAAQYPELTQQLNGKFEKWFEDVLAEYASAVLIIEE